MLVDAAPSFIRSVVSSIVLAVMRAPSIRVVWSTFPAMDDMTRDPFAFVICAVDIVRNRKVDADP